MKELLCSMLLLGTSAVALAGGKSSATVRGDYLEVRSCDVYTGACVANSEVGLAGKEAILVWSIRDGSWRGVKLDGLSVVAVVRADGTLGDVKAQPRSGQAVLVLDARADPAQQAALSEFARTQGGDLLKDIAAVKSAPITVSVGTCASGSCATVKAGEQVEISTRCLSGKDHLCGNEENYYPPLTPIHHAVSAFTELARFSGPELNVTWSERGKRSTYLGSFEL